MAHILLVEDNRETVKFLQVVLSNLGYTSDTTTGMPTSEQITNADLVIIDIKLPGEFDGWDVAQTVRAQRTDHLVPIIFYTAAGSTPEMRKLEKSHYIQKPGLLLELRHTIQKLLA